MSSEALTTIYSQHTVYLQRVGASQGADVIPYLRLIEKDVSSILNKYRKRTVTPSLQLKIQEEVNAVSRKHLQDYTAKLKTENRGVGAYEAQFASDTLNRLVDDDDFNAKTPSSADVNGVATISPVKLGDNSYTSYSSMMSAYWQRWTNEVDGMVQAGFQQGQTIPEISKAIMEQIDLSKSGTTKSVLDRSARAAKQLAITGVNHYANASRIAFAQQNKRIIKGYIFAAVLDSRTSQRCRSLDQTFWPLDSPKLSTVTPPLHPNCRSALIYAVDDRFNTEDPETKKRTAFDVDGKRNTKKVSSDLTYYESMKRLKAADQDDILGPTMGKAFRKMNNPDEFAKAQLDTLNNPLTIAEMKKRNNRLGEILRQQEKKT